MQKEAKARIKINKLLEESGWRFFKTPEGPANIVVEPHIKIEDAGDNFEKVTKGYVDYLLTDDDGFPVCVLEAKTEDKVKRRGSEGVAKLGEGLQVARIRLRQKKEKSMIT